jgi:hypothetical protein
MAVAYFVSVPTVVVVLVCSSCLSDIQAFQDQAYFHCNGSEAGCGGVA